MIELYPVSTFTLTLENCDFSGCFKKSNNRAAYLLNKTGSSLTAYIYIKKCVFDITYESTESSTALVNSITLTIEDSHFKTAISINGNATSGCILNATLTNCYITGSFDNPETSGYGFNLFSGNFYHTYFAIESQKRGKATLVGGTFYDTCFYDNQIWSGGTDITNSGKLYALPTEQCKDIEYLNSIGFYVAPGE